MTIFAAPKRAALNTVVFISAKQWPAYNFLLFRKAAHIFWAPFIFISIKPDYQNILPGRAKGPTCCILWEAKFEVMPLEGCSTISSKRKSK